MTTQLCVSGRVIGAQKAKHLLPWQLHGNCEVCKIDTLHGVGLCECSFRRDGKRVCRKCATAIDIERQGWSPLLSREENAAVKLAAEVSDPNRVIHREGEQEYEFVVKVSSFGQEQVAKASVVRHLMRTLNLAFGENVVVIDKARKRVVVFDPKAHGIGGAGQVQSNGNGNGSHA